MDGRKVGISDVAAPSRSVSQVSSTLQQRPDSVARSVSVVNVASKKVSIVSRKQSVESSNASTTHSEASTSSENNTPPESSQSPHQHPRRRQQVVLSDPSGGTSVEEFHPPAATEAPPPRNHSFLKVPSISSLTNYLHRHAHTNATAEELAAKRKYSQRVIRFSTVAQSPPPAGFGSAPGARALSVTAEEAVRRKQSAIVAPPEIVVKQRSWFHRKLGGAGGQAKKDQHLASLKRDLVIDDHELTFEQLKAHYQVDLERGLSVQAAAERLARDGPNILTPPPQKPQWQKFVHEFIGGFAILLWVAAGLSFLAFIIQVVQNPQADKDNLFLGIALVIVNCISGGLSYYQVSKSEKIMDSFKKLMPQKALVVRDGERHEIPASEVVLGDLCEVKFGDRIPADLRIIEARSMKVDNAALTGESEAQSRSPECTSKNPLETKNLAFFSTNCLEGTGKGIVCGIGDNTVMGRIASLTAGLESGQTSLGRELNVVVGVLSIMGVSFGITFFIVSGLIGHSWIDSLVYLVGIICGNVPLGLLPAISISLALAAKRMAAKQCLVKNLELVETLGSCSAICSDKTGTLTQNRMTVAHMWYDNEILAADTNETQVHSDKRSIICHSKTFFSYATTTVMDDYRSSETFDDLMRCVTLCNRATFKTGQENIPLLKRECNGDASETALLKFAELVVGGTDDYRARNKKVCEVPFNSTNKYQVSIHEQQNNPNYLLVMKGAAERIVQRCKTIMINHEVVPLDATRRELFNNSYLELGGMGERVLGFCHYELPASQFPRNYPFSADDVNFPVDGLTFLGLISMIDPPRATVPGAVQKCKEAGIRVIMVTGDHPITAQAIARAVGIISPNSKTIEDLALERNCDKSLIDPQEARACVIHGEILKDITSEELDTIITRHPELVFARTSPQQKLLIVEAFQRCGHRVAVTGDGVNDSPALKQANIGIAMGITGSDVSKQAADMILLDDNFASIVTGIEEGRTVFDNIKKNVVYNMTKGFPELIPFLFFIVANVPLPIGTVTIILIDMGSDMLPSISFSYEAPESDIMKRKPRPAGERMVNSNVLQRAYLQFGVIEVIGGIFTYFVVYAENGFWPLRLFGIGHDWENASFNNLEDSYGQEWTYRQRKHLEFTAYTAYFCSIIILQIGNAIACKTRRTSLLDKGMDNRMMNCAFVFSIGFGCFCSYVPGLYVIRMYPIRFVWWLPPLPYFVMILGYNELRQYFFRYWPDSWLDRNLYY